MKEGHGSHEYSTGDVYEGEWKADKKHGKGVFKTKEGNEKYLETWDMNKVLSSKETA